MDSGSKDSEKSNDHGEQSNTFDECRGDDHVGADGSGHFRLACDRLHGVAADEADAETSADCGETGGESENENVFGA